jgi:hypothetical protein
MFDRKLLLSLCVAVPLAFKDGTSSIPAQSGSDTVAIARAIADGIVHETRRGGDHHGPFVLTDSAPSPWGREVAAALRSYHPDLIAPPSPHALELSIEHVSVLNDTVRAAVRWSRCTGEKRELFNWWQHGVAYLIVRSGSLWHFAGRRVVAIADGHC